MTEPIPVDVLEGLPPQPVGPRSIVMTVSAMVTALLFAVLTFVPLPYSVAEPGPTFDLFEGDGGDLLLTVDGLDTYPPSGELRMTTVSLQGGPDNKIAFGVLLRKWLSSTAIIAPEEDFVYSGPTIQEQWYTSQEMALLAALSHLEIEVPATIIVVEVEEPSNAVGLLEVGDVIVGVNGAEVVTYDDLDDAFKALEPGDEVTVTVDRFGEEKSVTFDTIEDGAGDAIMGIWVDPYFDFPITVNIDIDNVGGSSGGTMFALAIVDLLTPEDELHGEAVAGTGTIGIHGEVGAIGGIALKMAGAAEDGAEWFLAPASNCSEVVGHVPEGLTVVSVSTLDEAYDAIVAIGDGETASLPTCS